MLLNEIAAANGNHVQWIQDFQRNIPVKFGHNWSHQWTTDKITNGQQEHSCVVLVIIDSDIKE